MYRVLLLALAVAACGHDQPPKSPPPASQQTQAAPTPAAAADDLAAEREEYLADTVAFTGLTRDQVLDKSTTHNTGMRDEWLAWEKAGPMTDARIKEFYKQTGNYIFDLGGWHLWDVEKHKSDVELVNNMLDKKPKNILDFGGGAGFNSLPLARAGLDVTLADLDGKTLAYAMFRAKRHDIRLKFWKSDVEPAPPDAKYDVIVLFDVLEHLPKAELHAIVDKLVRLKHPGTTVLIHAPFGRTSTHPMHLDETDDTKQQIHRLETELPQE